MTRWSPIPGPQLDAIRAQAVTELLYGGARGGGKSDFLLGDFCAGATIGSAWVGVLLRKSYPELEEMIARSQTMIPQCWPGSEWFKQEKRWRLPNGAVLTMRSLEQPEDAAKLQGFSFTWIGWDELGQFPTDTAYKALMATLRSAYDVPHKRIRATANPGGPGHSWIKQRFIDPHPLGYQPITDPDTRMVRIFIPAKVTDNTILLARDPSYVDRLRGVGSPELVRAWLDGDWTVVQGAYFPEFSIAEHVVEPRELPLYWHRFRSFDWGSARPFAVHWWAVSDGELPAFPRGALVCYREWYGSQTDANGTTIANTGLRMTAEEVADGILLREKSDLTGSRIMGGIADPSIFAEDGGPSIADRMMLRKCFWREGDNKRVARLGAMGGWDQLRARLKGDGEKPAIYFFSTCRDIIRTLPLLQHDNDRPEDVDTEGEDHAADSCFIRETLITTKTGSVFIADIRVGDLVATRDGYCPVSAVFSNGERLIYRISLSNGASLTGTANHPIWVEGRGFVALSELRYGDMLRPCASLSSAIPSKSFWAFGTSCAEAIIRTVARGFTELSGRSTTALFPDARIFITRTTTSITTSLKTWCAFVERITLPIMVGSGPESPPLFWQSMRDRQPLSGTLRQQVGNGITSIGSCTVRQSCMPGSTLVASNAAKFSRRSQTDAAVSAPMPVRRNGAAILGWMMWRGSVLAAAMPSWSTAMPMTGSARFSVLPPALTSALKRYTAAITAALRSRRKIAAPSGVLTVASEPTIVGRQKVFNLSVERAEEYFANGVLVHNCRYACMSRPYTAPLPDELDPPTDRYKQRRRLSRYGQSTGWAA